MDPITALLGAASLAGAIFGNQKKQIDPAWLAQHFGPEAATAEAQAMFNQIINSPKGQALINDAATTGQNFGNATQAAAAQAGLTPMGGGSSGTGVFATSAGDQASNKMIADEKAGIMQSVIPAAQQAVADRMRAYLGVAQQGGLPTPMSSAWQQIGNAAGIGLAAMPRPATAPNVATAPTPGAVTPFTANRPTFTSQFGGQQPTLQQAQMYAGRRRPAYASAGLVNRFGGNSSWQ